MKTDINSTCQAPDTVVSTCYVSPFISLTTQWGKENCQPHFINEENEGLFGLLTHP